MEDDFFDKPLEPASDIEEAYKMIYSVISKLEAGLPPEFFLRLREATFPVTFKKDEVIVEYGAINKHVYFALSGLVRLSRILKSRGETTVMFLTGGDLLISPKSFYTQTLSDEKLTALMDTFCIALPWADLQEMYYDYPGFNTVGRRLTEQYYRQALERATWFYESPEIRYENVLMAYPSVAHHVSVKELASYLGIAPETLSRIRHRMARRSKPSND